MYEICQVHGNILYNIHCVKVVRIRSYSGPYFPAFGKYLGVPCRIQSECGTIRTRITPNTDTFYAVILKNILQPIRACLVNLPSLLFTNMFPLPLWNLKNNNLFPIPQSFLHIILEISFAWVLRIDTLHQHKQCNGAVTGRSPNLTMASKRKIRWHWNCKQQQVEVRKGMSSCVIYFPFFSEIHIQFWFFFHIMVLCSVGSNYYKNRVFNFLLRLLKCL